MFNNKKRSAKVILSYYRYKAPLSAQDSPGYQREIFKEILNDLSKNVNLKKMHALDFGRGLGNNLPLLLKYFASVTAVDISQSAINIARDKHPSPKIKYIHLKNQKLPFKNNYFDFTLAAEVLEHVPSLTKTFKELERVTKKKNYLLTSTPNYWNLRGFSKKLIEMFIGEGYWDPGRAHIGGYERFMTPQKLEKLLGNFRIIRTCGSDYGTAWSPPMIKMYPQKFDNFFETTLGKINLLKKFGMNYYILAQKNDNSRH